jgi:hypothetical protein
MRHFTLASWQVFANFSKLSWPLDQRALSTLLLFDGHGFVDDMFGRSSS